MLCITSKFSLYNWFSIVLIWYFLVCMCMSVCVCVCGFVYVSSFGKFTNINLSYNSLPSLSSFWVSNYVYAGLILSHCFWMFYSFFFHSFFLFLFQFGWFILIFIYLFCLLTCKLHCFFPQPCWIYQWLVEGILICYYIFHLYNFLLIFSYRFYGCWNSHVLMHVVHFSH